MVSEDVDICNTRKRISQLPKMKMEIVEIQPPRHNMFKELPNVNEKEKCVAGNKKEHLQHMVTNEKEQSMC